jgi:DNA-binding transcriptional ArsR family regulator
MAIAYCNPQKGKLMGKPVMMGRLDDQALGYVADYFRTLSEPSRLKILNGLRDGERNVGELTELLGCSQANASKHLTALARAGLLVREVRGTAAYYRIADPAIYELCNLVCERVGERIAGETMKAAQFISGKAASRVKGSMTRK